MLKKGSNCRYHGTGGPIYARTGWQTSSGILHQGLKIKDVSLLDYRDKWVMLYFYPGDFTFV